MTPEEIAAYAKTAEEIALRHNADPVVYWARSLAKASDPETTKMFHESEVFVMTTTAKKALYCLLHRHYNP